MHIHGSPITLSPVPEAPELLERFWYWRGASGKNYIHSVYEPDNCPPLPGAIYVGVKRLNGMRIAVAVGRFGTILNQAHSSSVRRFDEIHVHLLARSPEAAEAVKQDLEAALREEASGLNEDHLSFPAAA